MKNFIAFLFLFCFAFQTQAQEKRNIIWFTEKGGTVEKGFSEGQTVPNLSIKDVFKKRFNLHDQLDKLTIIDLRSLKCQDCTKSNRALKQFYTKYNINIISVFEDKRSVEVKSFAQKNGMNWTNVQDNAPIKELFRKQLGFDETGPDYIIISSDKKVLKVFNSGKTIGKLGAFLQNHFK